MNGKIIKPAKVLDTSPHLEKLSPIGAKPVDAWELPQSNLPRDKAGKIHAFREESLVGLSNASRMEPWPNVSLQLPSHSLDGKKTLVSGTENESSLFSSSMSEIFSRKCKVSFHVYHVRVICRMFLILPF